MEQLFTISVFTENNIEILNRITIIFTRRHLSIESMTVSESEVKGVFRYTIVLKTSDIEVNKLIKQIEKLVDVLKAFVHQEHETVHQEIALYKIKTGRIINDDMEKVIRQNHARILTVDAQFIVIEKTGHVKETQLLFDQLKPYGILEFARSGTVAMTKPMKKLSTYLQELK